MASGLEKSAAIRPFATKKSRLASEQILLVDSLATESYRFSGQVGDQTIFQSGQRRCGQNVIVQGQWQSLSIQIQDAKGVGRLGAVDRVCE